MLNNGTCTKCRKKFVLDNNDRCVKALDIDVHNCEEFDDSDPNQLVCKKCKRNSIPINFKGSFTC